MQGTGRHHFPWVALVLLGCEVRLDDKAPELPGDERFSSSDERCSVASTVSVTFSLSYPEGTYLISADAGAGIAFGPDLDPCAAFEGIASGAATPVPLLELTPEEIRAGTETADGYRLALVPRSGFVEDGQGYLFYEKLLEKGVFDVIHVGIGVASLGFGEPAVRLTPNRFISEPTLLWLDSRGGRAASAVMGADGFAYVYNLFRRGDFDQRAFVARVPPAAVADAAQYRYFADDEWIDSEERAEPVLGGMSSMSVVHSDYLGAYVFVFTAPLSDTVYGRISPQPSGPFGELQQLYQEVAPEEFWIRDTAVHAGLTSGGGKTLLTSYFSDTGDELAGIHLVDVLLR
jgi:hypothetical protein